MRNIVIRFIAHVQLQVMIMRYTHTHTYQEACKLSVKQLVASAGQGVLKDMVLLANVSHSGYAMNCRAMIAVASTLSKFRKQVEVTSI